MLYVRVIFSIKIKIIDGEKSYVCPVGLHLVNPVFDSIRLLKSAFIFTTVFSRIDRQRIRTRLNYNF